MKVITIFYLLLIFPLQAQYALDSLNGGIVKDSLGGKPISQRFVDGRYLIYECDDKHYVCVDEEGYEKCQYIRRNRKIGQFENLGCAPLKVYDDVAKCFEKQKSMIGSAKNIPFCFKSNFQ